MSNNINILIIYVLRENVQVIRNKQIIQLFSLFVFLLLVFPSLTSGETKSIESNSSKQLTTQSQVTLSRIILHEQNDYLSLIIPNSTSFLSEPGKPMIPIIKKTYHFPIGTTIQNITCSFSNKTLTPIDKKIHPSPNSLSKTGNDYHQASLNEKKIIENTDVYTSSTPYPNKPFDYQITCGLENGRRMLTITLHCYPIRYQPKSNLLTHFSDIKIDISYILPQQIKPISETFDMVIITPQRFKSLLTPLVNHKNEYGIRTTIKTLESIYQEADQEMYDELGRDEPEKIKYFIKHAIEQWNISYVLLVGGHKNQLLDWHLPPRYSNLHDRDFWNDTYVTDLYYADIYKFNESTQQIEFDDWDSNQNDVIAEWTWFYENGWWYNQDKKDVFDLSPDVYIGRLACRNPFEVRSVVQKIIHYEQPQKDTEWFNHIILAGGDTFPYNDGACEGEVETDLAASYLEPLGFTSTPLWTTMGTLTGPRDVINSLREGAGFVYFAGHGTPLEWCTHPEKDRRTWIDVYSFQLQHLFNKDHLPICIVGGCHNSQFDVSLSNIIKGTRENGLDYFFWHTGIDCFQKWTWVPESWSWNLVSQKNDGFIAAIGNTGIGWGVPGEHCVDYNEGYINTQFFQVYAELSQQGHDYLGMIHGETINDYIEEFRPNNDPIDRKTIEQWVLLGDPSLKIGGYIESN